MALARLVAGRGVAARWAAAPLLLTLSWPLAQTPQAAAAPAPAIAPDVFPPSSVFRTLQLATLACGRDNTAERCAEARRQADPLLDHPRLPARCKDVLWTIRNLSVEAQTNSLARRDPIDQAAAEVTIACRQVLKAKPDIKPQSAPPAGGEGAQQFGGGKP
jgi:hypothetical protein